MPDGTYGSRPHGARETILSAEIARPAPDPAPRVAGPARSEGKASTRTAIVLLTALCVLALDQITKAAIRGLLTDSGTNSIPLLGGLVKITYVENRGAAFGLFQNQTLFFVVIGLLVVSGILVGHRFVPAHQTWLAVCLGLQMGGASGNLVDRLRFDGHVFDFVELPYWPVFNVADSAIVIGVVILAFHLLTSSSEQRPTDRSPEQ